MMISRSVDEDGVNEMIVEEGQESHLCNELVTDFALIDADDAAENDAGIEGSTTAVAQPDSQSFVKHFINSSGPPQILFICLLYALSAGSTVGVVPTVMTDQYARVYHGFQDDSCADYSGHLKPQACVDGNSDAQTAAATSSLISNVLTFLTSSLFGSMSDEVGRRNLLIIAQLLSLLSPICLVIIEVSPTMNPNWYFVADAAGGFLSWISIALSALSDVTPKKWRAPMFGLLLSSFSLGLALSPVLALGLSHFRVSILSACVMAGGFAMSVGWLPETLPAEAANRAREQRREYRLAEGDSRWMCLAKGMLRPFKELSILSRNAFFRLLSVLAFFSGMSTSADQTLLIYYVEEQLNFTDKDIVVMFAIVGVLGIIVQGLLLKPLTGWVGERWVVIIAFSCGVITNTLYSFAWSKQCIFVAVTFSTLGTMSFPTISSMKANNVEDCEQGRVQGALYALSSLASAVGPCLLRLVYQMTKDSSNPGSFFMTATSFFVVATFCAWLLPRDVNDTDDSDDSQEESLRPLIQDEIDNY